MAAGKVIVDDTPAAALSHPDVATAYLGRAHGVRSEAPGGGHLQHEPGDASTGTAPVVELKNVDIFYGPVQAIFGMSLRVGQGEAVAVLGGNASGKSTTIRTVLRLVTPRSGEYRLMGQEPPPSTAGVIGLALRRSPEGRRMFAELTVRDNLLMGAYARRDQSRAVLARDLDSVLAEFPWLAQRLNQLAGTLSGGEQQYWSPSAGPGCASRGFSASTSPRWACRRWWSASTRSWRAGRPRA